MSSFDRIVDMIDEKNKPVFPLTRTNIAFENVTSDPEEKWNTRVTVSARPTGEYVGSVNIYYTRTNMIELGPTLEYMQEDLFTLQALCDIINKDKNCQMTPEDLTLTELPAMESGVVKTFALSAISTSLVWLGNVQVSLLSGVPNEAKNLATFINVTLPPMFAKKP